jgi:hypothetical protein
MVEVAPAPTLVMDGMLRVKEGSYVTWYTITGMTV